MTIAISIRIGEGLVYAADSTSTSFETINGVSVLAQSFHHAQKLMQIRDYPLGVLTFGLGLIGTRNLESLLTEYESQLLPVQIADNYDVSTIAQGILAFIKETYDAAFPRPDLPPALPDMPPLAPMDNRPAMGIVVGGYSHGEFKPEEYVLTFPDGTISESRTAEAGEFGVRWWGQTAALQRLLLGFDPGVIQYLGENGVPEDALPDVGVALRDRLAWRIMFDGMPMQDAIDLSVFLTNIAIGQSRFVIGPPVCGGHVDVATISHRGFSWVRRKEVRVKGDSAFF